MAVQRLTRVRQGDDLVASLQPAAAELSTLMGRLAGELAAQADTVALLEDAAEDSRQQVQRGNRQLQAASERPSTMRDFMLALIAVLAFALLLLDWITP